MMNPFSNPSYLLPPLLGAVVTILLLVLVWQKGRRGFSSRILCCLLLSVGLWALFVFGMRSSPDTHQAVLWARLIVPTAFAIFVFYYHFSLSYTGTRGQRGILLASYLFLVITAGLVPTRLLVDRMVLEDYGYAPIMGTVGLPLIVGAMLLVGGGTYNLLRRYKASHSYEERNRLLYLIIASLFPLLGGVLDAFSDLPPAAIWTNLIFCILCSIAILKYHLLDIRLVVRKSLVYLLISAGIAIPYVSLLYLLHYIFKPAMGPWWTHALIILLLAIILRPLYSWAQYLVDRLFYRDRYDYLKALEQFSREAQSIVNLKELSATMTQLVSGALRTSSACLLLPSEGKDGFVVVSSTGLESPPSEVVLRGNSPVIKWLELHKDILSSEQFDFVPQLQTFLLKEKNILERMGAKLYVPIKTRQGQLSGILLLGQKLSQQSYSSEDKQLLTAVSNQMAMALENARLYEETRESERVLMESEAKYRSLVNDVKLGIFRSTPEPTGRFLEVNPAMEEITGYSREELLQMDVSDLYVHPEEREAILGQIASTIEKTTRELRFRKKDETEIMVSDTKVAVRDDTDNILYFDGIIEDITERKQAEEALRESKELFEKIFTSHRDAIFILDTKNPPTIVDCNPRAIEIFGYTRQEMLGRTTAFLHVSETALHKFQEHLYPTIEKCGFLHLPEFEMKQKDGTVFPTEHSVVPLKDQQGNRIGWVSVVRDITERKQAEEREKKLQQELYLSSRLASIGELAAGVAHEINNPLTGVLGFSQRLLRKSTDQEVSRGLEIIHNEALRAAKVVENLLTFARRREPKKEYSDINDVLQKALELRAYELKTSNIEVITDLAPSLPKTIVDVQQVKEVFLNIILNAEQAMSETNRGGKLTIKTQVITGNIRVSFTDNGPGIPAEHLDKLFDPFFTTREEGGGTGLGLSICHGIVVEHDGRIYARSKPGKGATFVVELPVTTEEVDRSKIVEA